MLPKNAVEWLETQAYCWTTYLGVLKHNPVFLEIDWHLRNGRWVLIGTRYECCSSVTCTLALKRRMSKTSLVTIVTYLPDLVSCAVWTRVPAYPQSALNETINSLYANSFTPCVRLLGDHRGSRSTLSRQLLGTSAGQGD